MNRPILLASLCATLLCGTVMAHAASTANAAAAQTKNFVPPPPQETAKVKRILKAMDKASTEGHPDLFGEFAGMRSLYQGHYADALKYFRIGAYYADKLSQYSIGMMYLKGRGVRKDRVTACAWIELAAERKYPKFVEAHNVLCAGLTPVQHDRVAVVLAKLLPEYGDKVAKPRMKVQLAKNRIELTGSHVGFDFGVTSQPPPIGVGPPQEGRQPMDETHCPGSILSLGGMAIPGKCGVYSPALLNPKTYFAARDAQFNGTVTVGALQTVNEPAARATRHHDQAKPAPASSTGH